MGGDGKIFLQKRSPEGSYPGCWEMPGGKVEPGERLEDATYREWKEELGLHVVLSRNLGVSVDVGSPGKTFRINLMRVFVEGIPTPLVGQEKLAWFRFEDAFAMPGACVPSHALLKPFVRNFLSSYGYKLHN